jgi:molybdopterin-containing oxidoreductase family iron-sulfur binding subunit
MVFGDLNDPESRVSQLAHSGRATRLLEDLGTKPKVFYLQKAK